MSQKIISPDAFRNVALALDGDTEQACLLLEAMNDGVSNAYCGVNIALLNDFVVPVSCISGIHRASDQLAGRFTVDFPKSDEDYRRAREVGFLMPEDTVCLWMLVLLRNTLPRETYDAVRKSRLTSYEIGELILSRCNTLKWLLIPLFARILNSVEAASRSTTATDIIPLMKASSYLSSDVMVVGYNANRSARAERVSFSLNDRVALSMTQNLKDRMDMAVASGFAHYAHAISKEYDNLLLAWNWFARNWSKAPELTERAINAVHDWHLMIFLGLLGCERPST